MIENGEVSASTSHAPATLQDLLSIAGQVGVPNIGMLRSTASLFVQFLGRAPADVLVDELLSEKEPFVRSLRDGKYAKNSIKSYRNYINVLLKLAQKQGWSPRAFEVPVAWRAVWEILKKPDDFDIVRFAITLGRCPRTLSDDDLTAWRIQRAKLGRALRTAEMACSGFRTAVAKSGLTDSFPLIKFSQKRYGVAMKDMEPALRTEIEALLSWRPTPSSQVVRRTPKCGR